MSMLALYSFDDEMSLIRIVERSNATIQAAGRTGKCLRMVGGSGNDASDMYTHLPIASTTATVIVGFAFKPGSAGNTSSDGRFLAFRHSSGAEHVVCYYDRVTGVVTAKVGATTIGTSSAALTLDQWAYIEAKILVDDVSGVFELRFDTTPVITFSGDTRNAGASAAIDTIRLMGRRSTTVSDFDDVYILDTAGSVNNTWLGDVAIECLRPVANGSSSQFTGTDGNSTDNYALVDETPPNTTDWVQAGTAGQRDLYAYGDLVATTGTVKAVQLVGYLSKGAGQAVSLKQAAKVGGDVSFGASRNMTAGWVPYVDVLNVDPASAAWTIASVNAAEFGVEVA